MALSMSGSMKVGLVIRDFDVRRGGAEVATHSLAHWLVQQGCQVHVVARRFGPESERMGIVPHVVRASKSRWQFAAAAERELRRLSLDVIHDFGVGWHFNIFQPHAGSPLGCQHRLQMASRAWSRMLPVWLSASRGPARERDSLMVRQFHQPQAIYVALSRMTANDLQQFHAISPRNIRQIHNGVDADRFNPEAVNRCRNSQRRALGLSPDAVMLLIMAHNFRLKGVATLAEATRRLVHERHPVRAVIAGHDKSLAGRYLRCRNHGSSAITFLGRIEDPRPLYAAADIYVHPTRFDNCSLAVMEAMACGLPVITTPCNGGSELITDSWDGSLMTDPTDAGDLVDRLLPLFDPAERARMGEAARQRMLDYPWTRHHQQVLQLYEQVIGQRRRRAG